MLLNALSSEFLLQMEDDGVGLDFDELLLGNDKFELSFKGPFEEFPRQSWPAERASPGVRR